MRHEIHTFPGREEIGHIAHHMGRLMNELIKGGFTPGGRPPDWQPAVDICELADCYRIIVELAGVERDDIEVYTEAGKLFVCGYRKDPCPREKVRLHQIEIEEGRFHREVPLPPDSDPEKITARYRDGFLRIAIPKRDADEPCSKE